MIEPLVVVPLRPVPVLPERPSASPAEPGEVSLLQASEVRVTSERLVVQGHAWSLADVGRVDVVRRTPRVWPLLAAMGASGMLGLPLFTSLLGTGPRGWGNAEAALVLMAMVFFVSVVGLLLLEDTYWLVLGLPGGSRSVFKSADGQLVARVAAVVEEALGARRRR